MFLTNIKDGRCWWQVGDTWILSPTWSMLLVSQFFNLSHTSIWNRFRCIYGHIYLKFNFLRILSNYYITFSSFWSSGTGSILLDTCHLTDCDPCRGGHMTNQIWSDQKPFDSFKLSLNETFLTWKCQERIDKGDDDEVNEQINSKIRKIFTNDERFSKNLEHKKFLNLR